MVGVAEQEEVFFVKFNESDHFFTFQLGPKIFVSLEHSVTSLKYSTADAELFLFETFSLEAVSSVTLASQPMYL